LSLLINLPLQRRWTVSNARVRQRGSNFPACQGIKVKPSSLLISSGKISDGSRNTSRCKSGLDGIKSMVSLNSTWSMLAHQQARRPHTSTRCTQRQAWDTQTFKLRRSTTTATPSCSRRPHAAMGKATNSRHCKVQWQPRKWLSGVRQPAPPIIMRPYYSDARLIPSRLPVRQRSYVLVLLLFLFRNPIIPCSRSLLSIILTLSGPVEYCSVVWTWSWKVWDCLYKRAAGINFVFPSITQHSNLLTLALWGDTVKDECDKILSALNPTVYGLCHILGMHNQCNLSNI